MSHQTCIYSENICKVKGFPLLSVFSKWCHLRGERWAKQPRYFLSCPVSPTGLLFGSWGSWCDFCLGRARRRFLRGIDFPSEAPESPLAIEGMENSVLLLIALPPVCFHLPVSCLRSIAAGLHGTIFRGFYLGLSLCKGVVGEWGGIGGLSILFKGGGLSLGCPLDRGAKVSFSIWMLGGGSFSFLVLKVISKQHVAVYESVGKAIYLFFFKKR